MKMAIWCSVDNSENLGW